MTGSSVIDDQLEVVINLLVRDFILNWYSEISHHKEFIKQLQRTLQKSCVSIANR